MPAPRHTLWGAVPYLRVTGCAVEIEWHTWRCGLFRGGSSGWHCLAHAPSTSSGSALRGIANRNR